MTFFECYADESFLRHFGFASKALRGGHSFGRSNVCGKLKKVTDSIGLIDEDPFSTQDSYLKHLLTTQPVYEDNYIKCLKDPRTNNKLIILRPDLEQLVIRVANEMGVDMKSQYRLPSDWKRLHELLMLQKNIKERERFMALISDLSSHKVFRKINELFKN